MECLHIRYQYVTYMIGTSFFAPVQVNLSTFDGFLDIDQITPLTSFPELYILHKKYF